MLRLFAERKIPSGHAARILGLERMDFLAFLKLRGIPAVDYTVEDWEADGNTIDEIERRRGMAPQADWRASQAGTSRIVRP